MIRADARAKAAAYIDKRYAPLDCDAEMAGRKQKNPRAGETHDELKGALDVKPPFTWK